MDNNNNAIKIMAVATFSMRSILLQKSVVKHCPSMHRLKKQKMQDKKELHRKIHSGPTKGIIKYYYDETAQQSYYIYNVLQTHQISE